MLDYANLLRQWLSSEVPFSRVHKGRSAIPNLLAIADAPRLEKNDPHVRWAVYVGSLAVTRLS
jgi:hypothetical protein